MRRAQRAESIQREGRQEDGTERERRGQQRGPCSTHCVHHAFICALHGQQCSHTSSANGKTWGVCCAYISMCYFVVACVRAYVCVHLGVGGGGGASDKEQGSPMTSVCML